MDDAVGVQVVQGPHQLDGNGPHAGLAQAAIILQDLVQLAVRKLGDQDKGVPGLKGVEEGDDVLVAQRPQDGDLGPQARQVPGRLAGLGDELEGDDLAGMLAAALVDLHVGGVEREKDVRGGVACLRQVRRAPGLEKTKQKRRRMQKAGRAAAATHHRLHAPFRKIPRPPAR